MFLICIFLKNFSDNEFYIFGGQHGYPDQDEDFIEGNNSEIYKLNLVTLKWTHLELIDKGYGNTGCGVFKRGVQN